MRGRARHPRRPERDASLRAGGAALRETDRQPRADGRPLLQPVGGAVLRGRGHPGQRHFNRRPVQRRPGESPAPRGSARASYIHLGPVKMRRPFAIRRLHGGLRRSRVAYGVAPHDTEQRCRRPRAFS